MNIPTELRYSKSHEWIKVDGNIGRIGISDFAQHELTDIVFVELPGSGAEIKAGEQCAVVESVKTASDIYSPISGKIVNVNNMAIDTPEILNKDPYGEGWLFEVEITNKEEIDSLFTADQYKETIG